MKNREQPRRKTREVKQNYKKSCAYFDTNRSESHDTRFEMKLQ